MGKVGSRCEDDWPYEVAISCLAADEQLAKKLYDLLAPTVRRIFFYTENQRELAGEDGMSTFADVFGRLSRLIVIIYRDGWGMTRWTRVEEDAITGVGLDRGWNSIIVYSVDGSAPNWLPDRYLWAGERFGLGALAGAIERKIQEDGGLVGAEDAIAMAQRVADERESEDRRERRRFSAVAVAAAAAEREKVFERAREIADNSGLGLTFQPVGSIPTAGCADAAIGFEWAGGASNSIIGAKLYIHLTRDGGLHAFGWRRENARQVGHYELHLAEDEETWLWRDEQGTFYSSKKLADRELSRLVSEIERIRKDRLERRRRFD